MHKFNVLVSPETSLKTAMVKMSDPSLYNTIPGFAVIVDNRNKVLGALTDGDIRKALVNGSHLNVPVEQVMATNPVMILYKTSTTKKQLHTEFVIQMRKHNKNINSISEVILIDDKSIFVDVLSVYDIIDESLDNKKIAIYGLGFVGLTLSLVMANKGFEVVGFDKDDTVIKNIKNNKPSFYENGLQSLLEIVNEDDLIHFTSDYSSVFCDIHLVTVGSPVINGLADLKDIKSVSHLISSVLKKGDVVIYRSTIPVGTTRNIIIPILKLSKLTVGIDFHVIFAPERTVEGNAIDELQSLPQIVGGYSPTCTEIGIAIFAKITSSVVEVEGLESAELIKLINNSFRDLVFAFANEVANVSDQFNINAFSLISAANKGYPRNTIPLPSPGVGGYCLTKDPYLFADTNSFSHSSYKPKLSKISRQINSQGGKYVYNKIDEYCKKVNKDINTIKILIIGIAFKGFPETSDIRYSSSIDLINLFSNKENLYLHDSVVSNDDLLKVGANVVEELEEGFHNKDAVIFMNNHPMHTKIQLSKLLNSMNDSPLFFDGWNQFVSTEVERVNNTKYSTMGYLS
jgi:UDP-N-acetyl-D-mannosaminuronic acid dehydrogenase